MTNCPALSSSIEALRGVSERLYGSHVDYLRVGNTSQHSLPSCSYYHVTPMGRTLAVLIATGDYMSIIIHRLCPVCIVTPDTKRASIQNVSPNRFVDSLKKYPERFSMIDEEPPCRAILSI